MATKKGTQKPEPMKATEKTSVQKRNFYVGKIPQKELDAAIKSGKAAEDKLYMQYHNDQKRKQVMAEKAKKEGKIK